MFQVSNFPLNLYCALSLLVLMAMCWADKNSKQTVNHTKITDKVHWLAEALIYSNTGSMLTYCQCNNWIKYFLNLSLARWDFFTWIEASKIFDIIKGFVWCWKYKTYIKFACVIRCIFYYHLIQGQQNNTIHVMH